MSYDFFELVDAINNCNEKLYDQVIITQDDDEDSDQWQESVILIKQRGLFLEQLSSIINRLNQQQIEIVGRLYESILVKDQEHLATMQTERKKVRDLLRSIKNAEKALPAYKAHNSNS